MSHIFCFSLFLHWLLLLSLPSRSSSPRPLNFGAPSSVLLLHGAPSSVLLLHGVPSSVLLLFPSNQTHYHGGPTWSDVFKHHSKYMPSFQTFLLNCRLAQFDIFISVPHKQNCWSPPANLFHSEPSHILDSSTSIFQCSDQTLESP